MSQTETRTGFRHFRNVNGTVVHNKGAITIAFSAPAKKFEHMTREDVAKISIAVCSRDDNFEHKAGRQLAQERLGSESEFTIEANGPEFADLLTVPSLAQLRYSLRAGSILPSLSDARRQELLGLIASARVSR